MAARAPRVPQTCELPSVAIDVAGAMLIATESARRRLHESPRVVSRGVSATIDGTMKPEFGSDARAGR